jgi:hypothetical protein
MLILRIRNGYLQDAEEQRCKLGESLEESTGGDIDGISAMHSVSHIGNIYLCEQSVDDEV